MKNKNQKVFETLINHEQFLSECQKSKEIYLQAKNEITLPRIGKLKLEGGNEKVLIDETKRIMNVFPRLSRVWEKSVKRYIQTGNLEMPSDKPPFIVYKQQLDDKGNVLRKDLYLQIFKSTTQKEYQDWWKEIETVNNEIAKYKVADRAYFQEIEGFLAFCNEAPALFKSSRPELKRDLLRFVVLNLILKDKKLDFSLKVPFNIVASYSKNENWQGRKESNLH